jgi:Signal transduction histidine kinase
MNTSNGIFSSSFIYGDLADNQKSDKLDWKHISELFFYIVAMTIKYLIFPTFTYNFWLYVMAYHIFLIILTLCDRQKKLYPFFSVLYFVLFGPLAIKFCHCFISAAILLTFAGPFMSLVYFRMKRLTQLHFVVEGIKVIFLYPKLVREVIEDRELDIQTLLYQECASLCLGLLSINFLIVMVYKQLCKYEANMNTYREKIEQVNISLQESLRERENFILSLSHDVRNLLNIIIGNTELAFEDATDPGIKEKLKSTKVCGDLLLSLINNVLDAGKIDLGNVEVCHSESMIRPTIEKLWHTCHELIKKKNLTGELKIFNNVPECLMLDQHRLNQILFNLIVNSVKFTEKGSIKLRISWSQEEDDPNDVAEENCQLDEEIKCRSNK